jgi:hypothetical protein
MVACAQEEALEILRKGEAKCERKPGKRSRPVLFCALCGTALCVKKPFAEKLFGYFVATK